MFRELGEPEQCASLSLGRSQNLGALRDPLLII